MLRSADGAHRRVWLTWEKHRRTRELAKSLNASLIELALPRHRLFRYLKGVPTSVAHLWRARRNTLVVQNPSLVLTALACIFRKPFGYTLVVDRHSNFRLSSLEKPTPLMRIFHLFSRRTVSQSDLTIVTNQVLANLVEEWGGRACILPDKLPDLGPIQDDSEVVPKRVVCISTFASDEPIEDILCAARLMADCEWFVTGNWEGSPVGRRMQTDLPSNVSFTGFIDDEAYQSLLRSADLVVVLTTNEDCLTCGAYESISLGIPCVLSNTRAIRDYFRKGASYADPTAESIAAAVRDLFLHRAEKKREIQGFRVELDRDWRKQFKEVLSIMAVTEATDRLV